MKTRHNFGAHEKSVRLKNAFENAFKRKQCNFTDFHIMFLNNCIVVSDTELIPLRQYQILKPGS